MKFRLIRTNDENADRILKKYPNLKNYDIDVVDGRLYITLKSFEELIKFASENNDSGYDQKEVVIFGNDGWTKENTIEIYDDYRE